VSPDQQEQIQVATVLTNEALRAHLDAAGALTGCELPGTILKETPSPADSIKEHIDD
jgi:hypothetical protein